MKTYLCFLTHFSKTFIFWTDFPEIQIFISIFLNLMWCIFVPWFLRLYRNFLTIDVLYISLNSQAQWGLVSTICGLGEGEVLHRYGIDIDINYLHFHENFGSFQSMTKMFSTWNEAVGLFSLMMSVSNPTSEEEVIRAIDCLFIVK